MYFFVLNNYQSYKKCYYKRYNKYAKNELAKTFYFSSFFNRN